MNEEGNPVSVLEQEPLDAGDLGDVTGDTETDEQDAPAPDVQDTVPVPPEAPVVAEEDDAAKAARLQAELDALKGGK